MVRVLVDRDISDPFQLTNEVKYGPILALTLQSFKFSVMLTDVFWEHSSGVPSGTEEMENSSTSVICRLSSNSKEH